MIILEHHMCHTRMFAMCEKCEDKGILMTSTFIAEVCECVKIKNADKLFSLTGIPRKMKNLSLEDWNLKQDQNGDDLKPTQVKSKEAAFKALNAVCNSKEFPLLPISVPPGKNKVTSIVFTGPSESGKSFCLAVLGKNALAKFKTVRYYEWYDLVSILDRFDNRPELDLIVNDFQNKPLILIDGMQTADMNNQAKNQLTRLFNYRMNNELWTVVSVGDAGVAVNVPFWSKFMNESAVIKLL